LAGIKENAVENVDREFAAQFGDGDLLGLQGLAHFRFQALLRLDDGLLLFRKLLNRLLRLVELVAEQFKLADLAFDRGPSLRQFRLQPRVLDALAADSPENKYDQERARHGAGDDPRQFWHG